MPKPKVYHKKVVVVFSGGLDSTVLLCHYLNQGYQVLALNFHYGQRHRIEMEAAAKIVNKLAGLGLPVEYRATAITLGRKGALSGEDPVPHGHYADDSMKATVVPYRNTVMIATAFSLAVAEGYSTVAVGCHSGDHPVYPDCRPEFLHAMAEVGSLGNWDRCTIEAPYVYEPKWGIVKFGAQFTKVKVPWELTYSCYEGKRFHCGKCGTCVERREAFTLAGVKDPTMYYCDTVADHEEED